MLLPHSRRRFLACTGILLWTGSMADKLQAATAGQDYQIVAQAPLPGSSVEVLEFSPMPVLTAPISHPCSNLGHVNSRPASSTAVFP